MSGNGFLKSVAKAPGFRMSIFGPQGIRQKSWKRHALMLMLVLMYVPTTQASPATSKPHQVAKTVQVSPPPEFLNSSVRVDKFPLFFLVSRMVERVHGTNNPISWESDGDGWILRVTRYDSFAQKTHHMAFEYQPFSATEVVVTRLNLDGVEHSGPELAPIISSAFKDLMGSSLQKPPSTHEECLARVAKSKDETNAYISDLKKQGKEVPFWLGDANKNIYDLHGNMWETCE